MTENPWKRIYVTLMILMVAVLALTVCASSVLADDTAIPQGPPPPPPPTSQCVASGDYLYVLDMRSIHKYKFTATSLAWVQTVTLPELPAPPAEAFLDGRPPMPPRPTMLIEGDALFVTEMRSIYLYSLTGTSGLEYIKTETLPEP